MAKVKSISGSIVLCSSFAVVCGLLRDILAVSVRLAHVVYRSAVSGG